MFFPNAQHGIGYLPLLGVAHIGMSGSVGPDNFKTDAGVKVDYRCRCIYEEYILSFPTSPEVHHIGGLGSSDGNFRLGIFYGLPHVQYGWMQRLPLAFVISATVTPYFWIASTGYHLWHHMGDIAFIWFRNGKSRFPRYFYLLSGINNRWAALSPFAAKSLSKDYIKFLADLPQGISRLYGSYITGVFIMWRPCQYFIHDTPGNRPYYSICHQSV